MLYVYFGNDTTNVRDRALSAVKRLGIVEAPTHIDGSTFSKEFLYTLAESKSLFGGESVIVLDTISTHADAFETLLSELEVIAHSPNHFYLIESTLTASQKRQLQSQTESFEESTAEKDERFNTFALTDALLSRDKKGLWLLFMEAARQGISSEEILGVLYWQVKTLRLVEKTHDATESGLKPFVYTKAKRALAHFKKGELEEISRRLLHMYHEGHGGKRDMSLALEQWILSL